MYNSLDGLGGGYFAEPVVSVAGATETAGLDDLLLAALGADANSGPMVASRADGFAVRCPGVNGPDIAATRAFLMRGHVVIPVLASAVPADGLSSLSSQMDHSEIPAAGAVLMGGWVLMAATPAERFARLPVSVNVFLFKAFRAGA